MDWEHMVPERYRITFEQSTSSFHILDTWHESIKNIPNLEQEIPPESPALKIINLQEINGLLGLLDKMGWIEKFKDYTGVITKKVVEETVKPLVETPKKSIQEIAIENITEITKSTGLETSVDSGVAREALIAIREVVSKV
jgi:hypothetical protein